MKSVFAAMYSIVFAEPIPKEDMGKSVDVLFHEADSLCAAAIGLFGGCGDIDMDSECMREFWCVSDFDVLKRLMKRKIQEKIILTVRVCFLLKAMGGDKRKLSDYIEQVTSRKRKVERYLGSMEAATVPIEINVDKLLKEAAEIAAKSLKSDIERESEKFEQVQYANHVCMVCRKFPAISFILPCGHAALCSRCEQELIKTNSVFERCYFCQERVKSLESLQFRVYCGV